MVTANALHLMNHRYLLFFLSLPLFISSCQTEDVFQPELYTFTVTYEASDYPIRSAAALRDFVKTVVDQPAIAIQDATVEREQDELGAYFIIRATYAEGDYYTKVAIPLTETPAAKRQQEMMFSAACTMTCGAEISNKLCRQEIIERCAIQQCACVPGSGANSSVVFAAGD